MAIVSVMLPSGAILPTAARYFTPLCSSIVRSTSEQLTNKRKISHCSTEGATPDRVSLANNTAFRVGTATYDHLPASGGIHTAIPSDAAGTQPKACYTFLSHR